MRRKRAREASAAEEEAPFASPDTLRAKLAARRANCSSSSSSSGGSSSSSSSSGKGKPRATNALIDLSLDNENASGGAEKPSNAWVPCPTSPGDCGCYRPCRSIDDGRRLHPLGLSISEKKRVIQRNGGRVKEMTYGRIEAPAGHQELPTLSFTRNYTDATIDDIFGFMAFSAHETRKSRYMPSLKKQYESEIEGGYAMSPDAIEAARGMRLVRGRWDDSVVL